MIGLLEKVLGGNPFYGARVVDRLYDFTDNSQVGTGLWTFTVTNSTAPTAVNNAHGGTVTFTNTTADNDRINAQEDVEWVKLGLGRKCLIQFKGQLNEVIQHEWAFGLAITDTAIFGDTNFATDIIGLGTNDGDAYVDLLCGINAANLAGMTPETQLFSVADATEFRAAIYLQMDPVTAGKGRVIVLFSADASEEKSTVVYDEERTDLPYDEELALFMVTYAGEATNAKTVTVDYLQCTVDRK